MADLKHVKGLDELQKLLDTLPAKIERNVLRGGLRAGAKIIAESARAQCPVSTPNAENQRLYAAKSGDLRASIRVTARVRGGKVTASVVAGGGDVYYARFVEYGTRPHTITAVNRPALAVGGGAYKSVEHPGARPRPFMRPALDAQADAAVVAAGAYIKQRLATKQGLDTADIDIEVTE